MYTRITPSNNGREALQYARGGENGKGHNNIDHRNLLVGGVNMLPDDVMSYEDQMEKYWNRASAQHNVQVRRIIGSFSKNELDPKDSNSKFRAMQMATLFSEQYYPDRQAAIFIQDDGVGGCIHFHLIVNDCDMISAKGCNRDQQKYWYVEKNFDELAKDYIKLDTGKQKAKDKTVQYERAKKQKSDKGEKIGYVWKDDLKERVKLAMSEASGRDDFLKRLTAHGVEGEYRSTKGNGDFIVYELTDLSGFEGELPRKREYFKAKSYKMGSDYGVEELDRMISEKQKSAPKAQDSMKPKMKNHWIQDSVKTDPKKPEEELKTEAEEKRDRELQASYDFIAGIDYFEDHKRWKTKPNYGELTKLSDERWKQFKEWYPDDYEERIMRGDISEPKSETVSVSGDIKVSRQGISPSKPSPKYMEPTPTAKPVRVTKRESKEEQKRADLIAKLSRDGKELMMKQKQMQGDEQYINKY